MHIEKRRSFRGIQVVRECVRKQIRSLLRCRGSKQFAVRLRPTPILRCHVLRAERLRERGLYQFFRPPTNTAHDPIVEILVGKKFGHLPGFGKQTFSNCLRIKTRLDLRAKLFILTRSFDKILFDLGFVLQVVIYSGIDLA
jgi:hypothetical protein